MRSVWALTMHLPALLWVRPAAPTRCRPIRQSLDRPDKQHAYGWGARSAAHAPVYKLCRPAGLSAASRMSIDTGLEQPFIAWVETVSKCEDSDQGMLGSLARLTCTVVWVPHRRGSSRRWRWRPCTCSTAPKRRSPAPRTAVGVKPGRKRLVILSRVFLGARICLAVQGKSQGC